MLVLKGHTNRIRHLAFAPDGKTLTSCAGRGKVLWLWDLATGTARQRRRVLGERLHCLTFSPLGDLLATGDRGGTVVLWDTGSWKVRSTIVAGPRYWGLPGPMCLAFSPDGRTLATPGTDGSGAFGVRRWDVASGGCLSFWPGYRGVVWSVACSSDGQLLASGDGGRRLKLWEVETGRELACRAQRSSVTGLAFSRDGRTLAAVCGWSVALYDVPSLVLRTLLRGHRGQVWALAFSPDGRTLGTASNDGTVKLWDTETGAERRAFDWGIGKVYAVAFAADGMRAAAGGSSDIVVWDVD
jgi:WD40 repeat protein